MANQDEIELKLIDPEVRKKFAVYFLNLVYSESKIDLPCCDEDVSEDELKSVKENMPNGENLGSVVVENGRSQTTQDLIVPNKRNLAANYVLGVVRNSAKHIPDIIG